MQYVVIVKTDFIEELLISGGTLISKCGEVRQAVTTTDAPTKKPVDSLLVSRFGKSTPGTGCIELEQLGNSD